ncbi:hypothetical protein KC926_03640 [Candidatus Kaiserbacteria bacterium]|nr:hypothetical protein [Candidatus Kaiserbacteria bacterium]
MNTNIKKIIKLAVYGFVLVTATAIALIPFLKKKEFTSDYSPQIRNANADIPPIPPVTSGPGTWCGLPICGDGDADDGGGI